jgi:hypothetical protein
MAEHINMTEGLVPLNYPTFHFYVHNIFEWRMGDDLHTLMKAMDKHKQTYWIWYVPGEVTSKYDISMYRPQVEGAFILNMVEYESRKKVISK